MGTISGTITDKLCKKAETFVRKNIDGRTAAQALTQLVDKVLISAFTDTSGKSDAVDLAFVAVGGYGRSEMAPYSDIDIMLLSRGRDARTTESAQAVFYKLWDMGLNISHCFRTLDECLQDAVKDPKTRTSIIDVRLLAGSKTIYEEFRRDIYPKILFKKKQDFVGAMLSEVERRHKTFEDSVFLLEPNIKDGIGGLRDMHTLAWLSRVMLKIDDVSGLTTILPRNEYVHLVKAFDFLLKIRLSLHVLSKRKNDVLSFEFQKAVAHMMGFKDTKRFIAPEIMMRLYYKKARAISSILDRIMNISGRTYIKFPLNFSIKRITDEFSLSRNEIIVKDRDLFKNSEKIMEAFALYSVSGRKLSNQVKDAIRGRALYISRKSRWSKKAVAHFLAILKGNKVYKTLREMHEMGVLDRFLPEFGRLRHLVIFEPSHRYTVDEHSLIALRNLEALKTTPQAKLGYLADILKRVRHDILFLAILLHDIGKGVSGSHEDSGYKMLKAIMERFGIDQQDRSRIEFLVRNHIVLSKLALTRDSDAPETILQLAEIVEHEENLDALYVMTYADMTAVHPDFWTDWKAYLFHDLYIKTKNHLQGGPRKIRDFLGWEGIRTERSRSIDEHLQRGPWKVEDFSGWERFIETMPDRYMVSTAAEIMQRDYLLAAQAGKELLAVAVHKRPDGTAEITVATNDQPGLFSKIVGVLSLKGLNILRARVYTSSEGLALDKILLSNWGAIWWEGLEERLQSDLYNVIVLGAPFPDEGGIFKSGIFNLERFIEIDNETSASYTLLELLIPDRIGLLFDIAKQLYRHGIDISSAVINTEGGVAQDVFYLHYNGGKLTTDSISALLCALYDTEIAQQAVNGES